MRWRTQIRLRGRMAVPGGAYCPEFLRLFFVQWFYNWSFQYEGPRVNRR
jgi:hypothetical protein